MKNTNPLVVRQLTVENFKRIEAVTITPDGNPLVLVNGNNDQGKSSTLEAMLAALLGKIAFPPEPVRRGAKDSRTRVELADASGKVALVVERLIRADGTHALHLLSPDPNIRQDQATLNRMLGALAFDPFEFSDLPAKEQAARLREAAGVDVSALEVTRKAAYDDRTAAGREVKRLEALVATGAGAAVGANERIDTAALVDDLAALQEQVNALQKRLRDAEQHNAWVAAQESKEADHRANTRALDAARARWSAFTLTIEECEKSKAEALAAAHMPVEGLELGDDVVLYRGVPLEQAGDATRLKVSAALGFALNPTIRVALIRQGSLLDENALADVAQIAADHHGQVWIERVGTAGPVGFVIENGRVVQEAK